MPRLQAEEQDRAFLATQQRDGVQLQLQEAQAQVGELKLLLHQAMGTSTFRGLERQPVHTATLSQADMRRGKGHAIVEDVQRRLRNLGGDVDVGPTAPAAPATPAPAPARDPSALVLMEHQEHRPGYQQHDQRGGQQQAPQQAFETGRGMAPQQAFETGRGMAPSSGPGLPLPSTSSSAPLPPWGPSADSLRKLQLQLQAMTDAGARATQQQQHQQIDQHQQLEYSQQIAFTTGLVATPEAAQSQAGSSVAAPLPSYQAQHHHQFDQPPTAATTDQWMTQPVTVPLQPPTGPTVQPPHRVAGLAPVTAPPQPTTAPAAAAMHQASPDHPAAPVASPPGTVGGTAADALHRRFPHVAAAVDESAVAPNTAAVAPVAAPAVTPAAAAPTVATKSASPPKLDWREKLQQDRERREREAAETRGQAKAGLDQLQRDQARHAKRASDTAAARRTDDHAGQLEMSAVSDPGTDGSAGSAGSAAEQATEEARLAEVERQRIEEEELLAQERRKEEEERAGKDAEAAAGLDKYMQMALANRQKRESAGPPGSAAPPTGGTPAGTPQPSSSSSRLAAGHQPLGTSTPLAPAAALRQTPTSAAGRRQSPNTGDGGGDLSHHSSGMSGPALSGGSSAAGSGESISDSIASYDGPSMSGRSDASDSSVVRW